MGKGKTIYLTLYKKGHLLWIFRFHELEQSAAGGKKDGTGNYFCLLCITN